MKFSNKETADLFIFIEEILNGKLRFLCSVVGNFNQLTNLRNGSGKDFIQMMCFIEKLNESLKHSTK